MYEFFSYVIIVVVCVVALCIVEVVCPFTIITEELNFMLKNKLNIKEKFLIRVCVKRLGYDYFIRSVQHNAKLDDNQKKLIYDYCRERYLK